MMTKDNIMNQSSLHKLITKMNIKNNNNNRTLTPGKSREAGNTPRHREQTPGLGNSIETATWRPPSSVEDN